jgi:hypothetical protein
MPLFANYGRLFQTGYVTRDLDIAMATVRRELGAGDFYVAEHTVPVLADGEPGEITMGVAIASCDGRQLEIIQPIAGAIEIYTQGFDFAAADLVFHHIGIGVTGAHANWEALAAELAAQGQPFKVLFPPDPGPEPLARYGYVDTRRWCGHYTEFLWWSEALHDSPTYPGFAVDR